MSDKLSAPGHPWSRILKESFGPTFWVFALLAAVMAGICYAVLGPAAFESAVARQRELVTGLVPRLAAAQVVAGLVWVLLPRERFSRLLGGRQGRRGLIIATLAGVVTPGGPASAFPFLAIIASTGADIGILVAYITSWALVGVQRIVVWDIPFMGTDFSLLRFFLSLPLPIVAGLIARRLPLRVTLSESARPDGASR